MTTRDARLKLKVHSLPSDHAPESETVVSGGVGFELALEFVAAYM
jgi:hypothetical protein